MRKLSTLGRGQGPFAIDTTGLAPIQRAALLLFLLGLGYKPKNSISSMLCSVRKGFPFVCADSDGYLLTAVGASAKFITLYEYDLQDFPNYKEIELKDAKAVAYYSPRLSPDHLECLAKLVASYKVNTVGRTVENIAYNLITQPLLVVTAQGDGTYHLSTAKVTGPTAPQAAAKHGATLVGTFQEVLDFVN